MLLPSTNGGSKQDHRLPSPSTECYLLLQSLDHAAMDSVGSHVIRLIQEPESFPFLNQQAHVL